MSVTVPQVDEWLRAKETAFEFKEAKNNFHSEKLAKYCCALANAGGGKNDLGRHGQAAAAGCGQYGFRPAVAYL